jgi:hypothetical protein
MVVCSTHALVHHMHACLYQTMRVLSKKHMSQRTCTPGHSVTQRIAAPKAFPGLCVA